MSSPGYLDSWDKIYSKRRRISLSLGESSAAAAAAVGVPRKQPETLFYFQAFFFLILQYRLVYVATFVVICLLSGQTHKKDSIHRQYLLAKFCGLHVLLGKSCAKPVLRIWGSYKSGLRHGAGRGWTLDQAKVPVVKNRKSMWSHNPDALFGTLV